MILLDEPSLGLAPQIVEEIFGIVRSLNQNEKVSFLPPNRTPASRFATRTTVIFSKMAGVVMDGAARSSPANEDVKESYLGIASGARRSFRT